MSLPPPKIYGSTLVFEASETLVRENAPFLVVVEEDVNAFVKKRLVGVSQGTTENDDIKGDIAIGFVGIAQLFSSS